MLGEPDIVVADLFSPDDLLKNFIVNILKWSSPLRWVAESIPEPKP